jgi:hypothetical protein
MLTPPKIQVSETTPSSMENIHQHNNFDHDLQRHRPERDRRSKIRAGGDALDAELVCDHTLMIIEKYL